MAESDHVQMEDRQKWPLLSITGHERNPLFSENPTHYSRNAVICQFSEDQGKIQTNQCLEF